MDNGKGTHTFKGILKRVLGLPFNIDVCYYRSL